MNVQALPPAGLRHGDRDIFRCPAAHRPHRMRRMHRIAEQHRFIVGQMVQQILIRLDKGRLPGRIEPARHRFRFAVVHARPMQQGDQARAALIGDAAFLLDPGANLARRARQRLGDPGFQPVWLRLAQPARAALVAEAGQPLSRLLRTDDARYG